MALMLYEEVAVTDVSVPEIQSAIRLDRLPSSPKCRVIAPGAYLGMNGLMAVIFAARIVLPSLLL